MKIPFVQKTSQKNPVQGVKQDDSLGQLPLDVLESSEEIRVIAPLAGVNIDEVEVVITDDVLTIKGERLLDPEMTSLPGVDHYAQECFWGKFSRSIILPLNVDKSQIEAIEKNHILYLRIPKKPNIKMRIVRVQSK